MVSIIQKIKSIVEDNIISVKRPLSLASTATEQLGEGSEPVAKQGRHSTMDYDRPVTWISSVSAYFSQLIRPVHRAVLFGHNASDACNLDDEPLAVGGVEVMATVGTPHRTPHRTPFTSPASRAYDKITTPVGSVRKKVYPLTPHPAADSLRNRSTQHHSTPSYGGSDDTRQYTTPHRSSRVPTGGSSFDLLDDVVDVEEDCPIGLAANSARGVGLNGSRSNIFNGRGGVGLNLNGSRSNIFNGNHSNAASVINGSILLSSSRIRTGGNDGLVDVDYEEDMMEGVEDEKGGLQSGVDIMEQLKYPGALSKFRFQPGVTSTTERKMARARDRKENRWSTMTRTECRIPPVGRGSRGGAIRKQQLSVRGSGSPRVTTKRAPYSTLFGRNGGISSITGCTKGKAYISMLGLSKRYRSTAQDCYKFVDKQAYVELLRHSSTTDDQSFSRSSSIMSVASSAPLSKTQMGHEWTRQRTEEIEQKMKENEEQSNNKVIPLWTTDQRIKQYSKLSKGNKDVAVAGTSSTRSDVSVVGKTTTSTATPLNDDDDIIITKETVKKVVRPNSLEQQARFSAFYKFTPDWMDDLNVRCLRKKADLERQRKESELTMKMCSERRMRGPSVEDAVTRRFQMLDMKHPAPRVEITEDTLVELTAAMEKVISNALRKNPPGESLTEKFNIQITRRDIATLDGLNWLNDEVVNFYMNMLMERGKNDNYKSVYAFNTFFYPKLIKMGFSGVKRWTKKVDIFNHELLLVPVHLGMHWCLATINVKDKMISYYDSMLGSNNQCLQELRKYLQSEHIDKQHTPLDLSDWQSDTPKDIPQQMNGSDCGMFACKFSEYLSRNRPITFTQDHMPYFRRRMVYEIVTNKLL